MKKLKSTSSKYYKNSEIILKSPFGETITVLKPSSFLFYFIFGGFYACLKKCWSFGLLLIFISFFINLFLAAFLGSGVFVNLLINMLTKKIFIKKYLTLLKNKGYIPLNREEANKKLQIRGIDFTF